MIFHVPWISAWSLLLVRKKIERKKEIKKKCTDKEKLNVRKVKNLLTGNKVPLLILINLFQVFIELSEKEYICYNCFDPVHRKIIFQHAGMDYTEFSYQKQGQYCLLSCFNLRGCMELLQLSIAFPVPAYMIIT